MGQPQIQKKRHPGGRPEKLNPTIQGIIISRLRAGNYLEIAAASAGIAKSTLHAWLRQGARSESGPYREFSDAVKRAQAEAEVDAVDLISKAANRNWQAAAWRLERKFPARWGRKDKVPASAMEEEVPPEGPKIDFSKFSYEETVMFEKLFNKATGLEEAADTPTTPEASEGSRDEPGV